VSTNGSYTCVTCDRGDVRLYRPGGEFLRTERIYCKSHLPAGQERSFLPLRVDPTDDGVWGHTSGPPESVAAWEALPEG